MKTKQLSVWLDKDLVQVIKNTYSQLTFNQELKLFFYNIYSKIQTPSDITVDSFSEMKKVVNFSYKLTNELTDLSKNVQYFDSLLVDIGSDIFHDENSNGYYSDNEESSDDCSRISSYFSAFHNRQEALNIIDQDTKSYFLLKEKLFLRKIEQIKKLYSLSDQDFDNYKTKNSLIKFLITHIDSNKDIVLLLKYKNLYNQAGQLYKQENIAKRRYFLVKKISKITGNKNLKFKKNG